MAIPMPSVDAYARQYNRLLTRAMLMIARRPSDGAQAEEAIKLGQIIATED
jgi:hypothetical protein